MYIHRYNYTYTKEANMKKCSICSKTKDLHEFDKIRLASGEQTPTARCKACRREYTNQYNAKKGSATGLNREEYLSSVRKPQLSPEEKQQLGQAKWDAWHKEELERQEQKRKDIMAKAVQVCGNCNEELPLSQFPMRKRKRKSGSTYRTPSHECKTCKNNKEAKHRASPKGQDTAKLYRKSPAGKAKAKRNRALRDKRSKQATPKWLNPEQKQQILDIYEHMRDCRSFTGEDYHVDHIVPLRGENVCGLHVPWNLQVLPAYVNISKSNKVYPLD